MELDCCFDSDLDSYSLGIDYSNSVFTDVYEEMSDALCEVENG